MDANTLLKSAIGDGTDKLSSRDCWLCLAQIYSSGNSAEVQLSNAISDGLDKLSDEDVLKCIASILSSGTPSPVLGTPTNPAYSTPGSDSGQLTWDFSGFDDPDHWQLQAQLSDNSWTNNFSVAGDMTCIGSGRTITVDGAGIDAQYGSDWNRNIRVIGKNADDSNATNPSAAVFTNI
jgi:hypothetical protein